MYPRTSRTQQSPRLGVSMARYLAKHPDARHIAVAKHVADVCEGNAETVRKALRAVRRKTEVRRTPK